MQKFTFIAAGLALMTLTACVASQKSFRLMTYSEKIAFIDGIIVSCEKQGVKRNTKEMERCAYSEFDRTVAQQEQNAETRQRIGAALQGFGDGMKRNSTTCNTNVYGNSATTRCY